MFCYDIVAEPELSGSASWLLLSAARAWPAVLLWENSLVRDAMEYVVRAATHARCFARAVLVRFTLTDFFSFCTSYDRCGIGNIALERHVRRFCAS